jgi:hypothetical protein
MLLDDRLDPSKHLMAPKRFGPRVISSSAMSVSPARMRRLVALDQPVDEARLRDGDETKRMATVVTADRLKWLERRSWPG